MDSVLTHAEYEERKECLEELKLLSKTEHIKILEILKEHSVDYSENCNGIFFDLVKVSTAAFSAIKQYLEFCSTIRNEESLREEEERKAQDCLR
jgi:hypothetical protein